MNLFEKISHIYIQVEPCDLRKGIDGYAALVNSEFNLDPMDSNSLYIFCNRNHNKLKCLYYDGTGFWLLYKRLESGTFKWSKSADEKSLEISEQQLKWLLEGLKMEQKTAFKEKKMIPKVIHYCWFGLGSMSKKAEKCMSEVLILCINMPYFNNFVVQ